MTCPFPADAKCTPIHRGYTCSFCEESPIKGKRFEHQKTDSTTIHVCTNCLPGYLFRPDTRGEDGQLFKIAHPTAAPVLASSVFGGEGYVSGDNGSTTPAPPQQYCVSIASLPTRAVAAQGRLHSANSLSRSIGATVPLQDSNTIPPSPISHATRRTASSLGNLYGLPRLEVGFDNSSTVDSDISESEESSIGRGNRAVRRKPITVTSKTSHKTKVAIVGGGPVGLSLALRLKENTENFEMTIFERRWKLNPDNGRVEWQGKREGNNRRLQVVTLQSNVWSKLPKKAQDALFGEDGQGPHHVEMWPYGPDSPEQIGSPRNIPIRQIEDILLELIQQEDGVTLNQRIMEKEDMEEYDVIVLADGGRRSTEERLFNGVFGPRFERDQFGDRIEGTGPFVPFAGESEENELSETVLGIYIEHPDGGEAIGVSEAEGMTLTVSQNRFLLNPLGSTKGYLNMWLTKEEASNALGIVGGGDGSARPVQCTQSSQCTFERNPMTKAYCCPTHGSFFLPAMMSSQNMQSLLWDRILEGLQLYGINPDCVKAFTTFRLGPFRQRQSFYSQLRRGTNPPLNVFVVGDCAFNVSFRAGRGLNTGVKAAISLATALSNASDLRRRMRMADFVDHSGFMSSLQEREVLIRSLQMMRIRSEDGYAEETVTNLIAQGLATNTSDAQMYRQKYKDLLQSIAQRAFNESRIPRGISKPNLETLFTRVNEASDSLVIVLSRSGAWNTVDVGGHEPQPRVYQKDNSGRAIPEVTNEEVAISAPSMYSDPPAAVETTISTETNPLEESRS